VSICSGKRNRLAWCSLLLGAIALTGCEPEAPAAQRSQRSVVDVILTVHNESRQGAQVLLAADSMRVVLGDLASGASQSFSVPSSFVGSPSMLRLEAVGDGRPPVRSNDFRVRRGEKVVWSFTEVGRGKLDSR
jgi:hypothetical protein